MRIRSGLPVALTVVVLCSAHPASAVSPDSTANYVAQLKVFLNDYQTDDSTTNALVDSVRNRMPYYEQLIAEAERLRRRSTINIAVLLQHHPEAKQSLQEELLVSYSQFRIRQVLDSLHCQVVGSEGLWMPRVTWLILEQAFMEANREAFGPEADVDTLYCQLSVIQMGNRSGEMMYWTDHPLVNVFGFEDKSLLYLNATIKHQLLQMLWAGGTMDGATPELFMALSRARSEIAVAKTILALRQFHETRAAIVIGYKHGPEMEKIFQRYNIPATFFHTTPTGPLPGTWWK